jgi:hypothetical protein
MPIEFTQTGDFKKTEKFLKALSDADLFKRLEQFGSVGVAALSSATPRESGATAASWGYKVTNSGSRWTIVFTNSHIVGGAPLAILLQYGHGTGTGGYVQGRDYINPAIAPVFDKIADEAWKAVISA